MASLRAAMAILRVVFRVVTVTLVLFPSPDRPPRMSLHCAKCHQMGPPISCLIFSASLPISDMLRVVEWGRGAQLPKKISPARLRIKRLHHLRTHAGWLNLCCAELGLLISAWWFEVYRNTHDSPEPNQQRRHRGTTPAQCQSKHEGAVT